MAKYPETAGRASLAAIATLAIPLSLLRLQPASAQSITPSGSGTQVTPSGTGYQITGGSTSGDGGNLFHSFEQFGLSAGESANFIADPAVQNILGRITGGDASLIDGTLQVTEANANLYLINPAGILFGSNARLDLPAAFTATTANSVGFGSDWFSTTGSNNYAALIGDPTAFIFTAPTPGSIVNAGDLAVDAGQSLTLLGGSVVNTGSLSAPGGSLTLAAVPGESRVRLSHEGLVLSLEVEAVDGAFPTAIAPLELPQLLTAAANHATGLTVSDDGTVQLSGSGLTIPTEGGSAIASGSLNVDAQGSGQGGQINVLGDIVGIVDATLSASGPGGGGDIRIGGEYLGQGSIPNARLTYVDANSQIRADATEQGDGGRVIVWSDETTRSYGQIGVRGGTSGGDGGFVETSSAGFLDVGGTPDISAPAGQGGTWLIDPFDIEIIPGETNNNIVPTAGPFNNITAVGSPSQIGVDNIVSALLNGNVTISTGTGGSEAGNIAFNAALFYQQSDDRTLELQAAGSIALNGLIQPEGETGALNLRLLADTNNTGNGSIAFNAPISLSGGTLFAQGNHNSQPGITTLSTTIDDTGGIVLQGSSQSSPGVVLGGGLFTDGDIEITGTSNATTGILVEGPISANGNISLSSNQDIEVEWIETTDGNILITTDRFLRVTGSFLDPFSESFEVSIATLNGGITITHGGNGITPFTVGNASVNGTAAAIATSSETILPTQTFFPSYIQGNISILTGEPPTDPGPDPDPSPDPDTPEVDETCIVGCETSFDDPDEANDTPVLDPELDTNWLDLDGDFSQEFIEYLDLEEDEANFEEGRDRWAESAEDLGVSPALIYVAFLPAGNVEIGSEMGQHLAQAAPGEDLWQFDRWSGGGGPAVERYLADNRSRDSQAELELVMVVPDQPPIRRRIAGVTRGEVLQVADQLRREILDPTRRRGQFYQTPAQQMHSWLVEPLLADLEDNAVDNIAFILDAGLRSLPVAALYDGDQFLIENYSVGLMPSLSLTDTRHVDVRNAQVLAMGASEFDELPSLPAVPLELSVITEELWPGQAALNQSFTQADLTANRSQTPYSILHLATHGEFLPGPLSNSFLQFWDQRLQLDQLRQLQLNNPPVDLMVLSACRMALGDEEAELGFAGVAVKAGVRTVVASLWTVDDTSTAGLMSEFYTALQDTPVRAEALRQAQMAMVRGEAKVEDGLLRWSGGEVPLPPELANQTIDNLAHPFFWSGFTLVGSPW
jgi:filamentous hemagglutinin family protein